MIYQRTKDILYLILNLYSKLFYPFYKFIFLFKKEIKLNLGSGKVKIKKWINVDINLFNMPEVIINFRDKFPFPDNSVKAIFTTHCLEHLYIDELSNAIKEMYRIICVGGVVRIVVPSLEKAIQAYLKHDNSFFSAFPRHYKTFGGKFTNFIFCDGQHKIAFDFNFLSELLSDSGFKIINEVKYRHSSLEPFIYQEIEPYEDSYKNNSLFVEAIK